MRKESMIYSIVYHTTNYGKKKERLKRVTSAAIMFPIVAGIFIFANNYVMDIAMCVLSIFCLYEYFHCFRSTEKANPSSWLGYISSVLIILHT